MVLQCPHSTAAQFPQLSSPLKSACSNARACSRLRSCVGTVQGQFELAEKSLGGWGQIGPSQARQSIALVLFENPGHLLENALEDGEPLSM